MIPEDVNLIPENITTCDISPDAMVDLAQRSRLKLLKDQGMSVKEELIALKDLSDTALKVTRLKQDNDNASKDREVAVSMAKAVQSLGTNPYHIDSLPPTVQSAHKPVEVPQISLVPEETSTEVADIKLKDIQQNRLVAKRETN